MHSKFLKDLVLVHEELGKKHKFGVPLQTLEVFRLQIQINPPTLEYVNIYAFSEQETVVTIQLSSLFRSIQMLH